MTMKNKIKEYAIQSGLNGFKSRCGLPVDPLDKTLLEELSKLLPVHYNPNIKGRVDKIETLSYAVGSNEYYPRDSFYRVSITYSGQIPKENVELDEDGKEDEVGKIYGRYFFRNSTVHYDKEMNLISVQHHNNQGSYKWHEYSSQFENIFK